MKSPIVIEVNYIDRVKGDASIRVSEAKMRWETPAGEEVYYFRYYYVIGNTSYGSSVLNRWFVGQARTPVPEAEWDSLSFIRGSLAEPISNIPEPGFP